MPIGAARRSAAARCRRAPPSGCPAPPGGPGPPCPLAAADSCCACRLPAAAGWAVPPARQAGPRRTPRPPAPRRRGPPAAGPLAGLGCCGSGQRFDAGSRRRPGPGTAPCKSADCLHVDHERAGGLRREKEDSRRRRRDSSRRAVRLACLLAFRCAYVKGRHMPTPQQVKAAG